ncbi:MAG: ABC transporter permease [Chloroflexota bacterium]
MNAPAAVSSTETSSESRGPSRLVTTVDLVLRSVGPIVLALIACGLILVVIGRDPIGFYGNIITAGLLRSSGLQDTITRMAPALLIAGGLVIVFRANLWNLGSDGQFLLAAAAVAGTAPAILSAVPVPMGWIAVMAIAMCVGAAWTLIPALLKARYGINEIITTLMMAFIGIGAANLLVKGPFKGPTTVPQTQAIPTDLLLPVLPGTRIHVGVIIALVAVVAIYSVLSRTSFGTRLDVLGANPRAAAHLGINVPRVIVLAFMASGAMIGLAAAVDILGIFGYMRADWNPAYGLKVIPLVFLARLNALAIIPFAAFFGVISIGGEYATRQARLPSDFLLLLTGLILVFMVATQYFSDKRARGEPIFVRRQRKVASDF